MFCVACGGDIPAGSRFCPRCGRATSDTGAGGSGPPLGPAPDPPPGSPPPGPPSSPPPPPPPPPPPGYGAGPPPPPPPPPAYGGNPPGYGAPPGYPPPGYGPSGYPVPPVGIGSGPVSYGLASLGQRVGGWVLDQVITSAIFIFAGVIAGLSTPAASFDNPNPGPSGIGVFLMLVCFAAGIAYYPYFEGRPDGQTPGKKAAGTRVVRQTNGAPLGYGLAIGRSFARLIDFITFFVPVGLLWALWDSQHQTWHDKIAGTLVVRSSVYPPANPHQAG